MSQEHQIIVSNELSEVYRGFSQMTTTMECLAESRTVAMGDEGVSADILDLLSTVARSLLDKLDGAMMLVNRSTEEAN